MYMLIDELPPHHTLPLVPSQLWYLLTLEFVVADENGRSLLMIYPSYSLQAGDAGDLNEGYWTPPFFGYPVDLSFTSPDTAGAVMEVYQHFEAALDRESTIRELAYLMGLPNPQIELTGSFVELKRSPRTPEVAKCYKVVRYSCINLGPRGRRNLADPECRKGYVFLPLDELEDVVIPRFSAGHGRVERLYLSKPIISNLDHVLSSPNEFARLKDRAITLSAEDFSLQEEGVVVCMDLAGYGTVCKYAAENMGSFHEFGPEIATHFRGSVANLFYSFLGRTGISQVHIAGDGFIAAMPIRHFPDGSCSKAMNLFMSAYTHLLDAIDRLNGYIADPSKRIGSRLALHYGQYSYGRIAKTRSISADFDGASIIEVARLEGALREYIKGPIEIQDISQPINSPVRSTEALAEELAGNDHTVICSSEIMDRASNWLSTTGGMEQVTELRVSIKEFVTDAVVYRLIKTGAVE